MTDLHTHILPGMDDGARDMATSVRMLRMEWEQGVEAVALTPHFYCDTESVDSFLKRRQAAFERLEEEISRLPDTEALPRRILGAEVAWAPHMERWEKLRELCYAGSSYLLLELPSSVWSGAMFRQLYELMDRTGVTPVIAHIDRYWGEIDKSAMEELFSIGLPVQLSAAALTHWRTRGTALRLLREDRAQILISDAHGVSERAPDIADALKVIRRRDASLYDALTTFSLSEQS